MITSAEVQYHHNAAADGDVKLTVDSWQSRMTELLFGDRSVNHSKHTVALFANTSD